ncbi:MAG: cell division protein [Caulobacter sp.]|nr:cell division protein [Caulobacter sp.]
MISVIFTHRTRGFRTINVLLTSMLVVLAVGVNLAKTFAGKERTEIVRTERAIRDEGRQIRVLQAEVAHLEQPERLERLSRAYLAMAPVTIRQETTVDDLHAASLRRPGAAAPVAPIQASTEPVAPSIEAEAPSETPTGETP